MRSEDGFRLFSARGRFRFCFLLGREGLPFHGWDRKPQAMSLIGGECPMEALLQHGAQGFEFSGTVRDYGPPLAGPRGLKFTKNPSAFRVLATAFRKKFA